MQNTLHRHSICNNRVDLSLKEVCQLKTSRRGDIPSAAVRIRPLSVRSADGQVKEPGRTADGQCGRTADGCGRMRTDSGRTMLTDNADGQRTDTHGQRTDADGRRTDGGRTADGHRGPCAVRAQTVQLFYIIIVSIHFLQFFTFAHLP